MNRTTVSPMKCADLKPDIDWTAADPFTRLDSYFTSEYAMELKLDGCQVVLVLGEKHNQIFSKGRDVTANLPVLEDAVVPGAAGTVLVGELVAMGPKGQVLGAATALLVCGIHTAYAQHEAYGPPHLFLFDIVADTKGPVTSKPYTERREALEVVAAALHPVSRHSIEAVPVMPSTKESVEAVLRVGGEGVVIKRKTSHYVPGSRSAGWYKIKRYSTADGIVMDWEPGKNANKGKVGSLVLGLLIDGELTQVAKVGNLDAKRPGSSITFRDEVTTPEGTLQPSMYGTVVEFMGQCLGVNGKVRHPHLIRWCPEKDALDCTGDQLKAFARSGKEN